MRAKILAKAALLDSDNNVLLLRRSATDQRRPGEQDFPGGEVERGEDIEAGLIREISEEVGLDLEPSALWLVYAATEPYDDKSVTRLLFVGRVETSKVRLSAEHDAYQWLPLNQALSAFPHHVYGAGLAYAVEHGLLP